MVKKSLSSAVAALLLALLAALVSVAAAPASAVVRADGEMSEQRAGQYFLRSICTYDEARARFNGVVVGADNAIGFDEVKRRLPVLKRAAGAFAPFAYRYARALLNPPKAWPSTVSNPVDTLANKQLQIHGLLQTAASATRPIGWYRAIAKAVKLSHNTPSATIRARLDLPPPGRGC